MPYSYELTNLLVKHWAHLNQLSTLKINFPNGIIGDMPIDKFKTQNELNEYINNGLVNKYGSMVIADHEKDKECDLPF